MCGYTQQNDIVERKNKHILDIKWVLFQMSLSLIGARLSLLLSVLLSDYPIVF